MTNKQKIQKIITDEFEDLEKQHLTIGDLLRYLSEKEGVVHISLPQQHLLIRTKDSEYPLLDLSKHYLDEQDEEVLGKIYKLIK